MSIKTRKTYPTRSFYRDNQRIAFYVINVLGVEPEIVIYSGYVKGADCLGIRKSELENDAFRVQKLLEKHFPKKLAEAIYKYAMKDMGCKGGFSLKSYISWKQNR